MDLVFIHGPAAAGKLTVARALAKRTGFGVFHNHLVVDAALAAFDFGDPSFCALREAMWLMVFAEAARRGRSLIFTFAPDLTVRPEFIGETVAAVEQPGGRVRFVRLDCPEAVLEQRVGAPSRAEFRKLRDVGAWKVGRAQNPDAFPPIPDAEVAIDTSRVSPDEAATCIIEALGLAAR